MRLTLPGGDWVLALWEREKRPARRKSEPRALPAMLVAAEQATDAHAHRRAEERGRAPEPAMETRRGDAAEHRPDIAAVGDAGAIAEEQPARQSGHHQAERHAPSASEAE